MLSKEDKWDMIQGAALAIGIVAALCIMYYL
jgi:hypothetical protein